VANSLLIGKYQGPGEISFSQRIGNELCAIAAAWAQPKAAVLNRKVSVIPDQV